MSHLEKEERGEGEVRSGLMSCDPSVERREREVRSGVRSGLISCVPSGERREKEVRGGFRSGLISCVPSVESREREVRSGVRSGLISCVPSGDRRIARAFIRAIELKKHKVSIVSEFQSRVSFGDSQTQKIFKQKGEEIAESLIKSYSKATEFERPKLWFTYHLYYKAVDH